MSEISVERHPAIRSILDGVKPVRKLTTKAEAIAAAREAADEIRKLAKDASLNDQVPVRQADILSEYGLTSIYVPREFGGLGASIQTIVEVVRIISAADGGVGQILQIHNVKSAITPSQCALQNLYYAMLQNYSMNIATQKTAIICKTN